MNLLLLGMTCAGKSTLAPTLAQRYGLTLLEADDEVQRLNDGVWPLDEATIDTYFAQTTPKVLQMEQVLYVISWLSKAEIQAFYQAGFKLVELHASYDEIKRRKVLRDDFALYGEARLRRNFHLYFELINDPEIKRLFSVSVDSSELEPDQVRRAVTEKLEE